MKWYFYSGMASFSAVFYFFILRILLKTMDPTVLLMFIYSVALTTLTALNLALKKTIVIETNNMWLIVALGVMAVAQTVLAAKGMKLAPNPGYSQAVCATYIVGLVLLSSFALGAPLTPRCGLGIALVIVGITLIVV